MEKRNPPLCPNLDIVPGNERISGQHLEGPLSRPPDGTLISLMRIHRRDLWNLFRTGETPRKLTQMGRRSQISITNGARTCSLGTHGPFDMPLADINMKIRHGHLPAMTRVTIQPIINHHAIPRYSERCFIYALHSKLISALL